MALMLCFKFATFVSLSVCQLGLAPGVLRLDRRAVVSTCVRAFEAYLQALHRQPDRGTEREPPFLHI